MSLARVYIASSLENAAAVRELRDELARHDVGLTYDWTAHGSVQSLGEDRIAEVAALEAAGVHNADLVIVLLPGGRGTHTEMGIALGATVPVLLVADPAHGFTGPDGHICAFYLHHGVARAPAGSARELARHVVALLELDEEDFS